MPNDYIESFDNADLTAERRKCSFSTQKMTARLYGDEKFARRRREILSFVRSTPELDRSTTDASFMSRLEAYENTAKNTVLLQKYKEKIIDKDDLAEYHYLRSLIVGDEGYPFGLHGIMLIPMIEVNADESQRSDWLQKARNQEFIGTYAQTEMGHGTNLKRLETTATYDPKTQEFVLNSPTLTATKWLPGNLGKSANFVVVMAQLWTKGKCYGPHGFMVQIRHPDTHEALPGITVGDIGPKVGINTNDNGFLRFDSVRIPRRNMLMGFAKVEPDGTFRPPIHSKIGYASMMFVRSVMIHSMAHFLAQTATIAIRYSCVRRQGTVEGTEEVKILDYHSQQYRLLPQLARAYCYQFAGHYSKQLYYRVMDEVRNGKTELMSELHSLNCGLKSVVSFQTALGIEQCRMACGGHGYSKGSGIPQIFGNAVGGCTYEGENMVMLLQLASSLVKVEKGIRNSTPPTQNPTELTAYLFNGNRSPKRSQLKAGQNPHDQWWAIQAGFEHISRQLIIRATAKLQNRQQNGESREKAWTNCGVDLCKAARAHTRTFLSRYFIRVVEAETDKEIKNVLSDVLHLYLHYELQECRADHFEDGYLSGEQCEFSRNELDSALAAVRRNAVNLVDSFDFADRQLNSALGRRDGHVYDALFRWAQQSELNRTDVPTYHHSTLGQIMRDGRRKNSAKL